MSTSLVICLLLRARFTLATLVVNDLWNTAHNWLVVIACGLNSSVVYDLRLLRVSERCIGRLVASV